jgi:hypothetical protein
MPSRYIEINNYHPEYIPQHFEQMISEIVSAPEADLGRVLLDQIKPGISIQVTGISDISNLCLVGFEIFCSHFPALRKHPHPRGRRIASLRILSFGKFSIVERFEVSVPHAEERHSEEIFPLD